MAQDYKVVQVSTNEPRVHTGDFGTTYYISVKLEGHPRPVSIGKKAPDALKPGDIVYGTILPSTKHPTDNFKPEKKQPYQAAQGGQPKDQDTIRAQWAINAALQLFASHKPNVPVIEEWLETEAKEFYAMVDRVKGSSVDLTTIAPNVQVASKQHAPTFSDGSPVPDFVEEVDIDAPIDLSEIPF